MVSSKLEYIWLDGYKPIQSLRSKTKIEKNLVANWKIAQHGALTVHQLNKLLVDHLIVY
jgi:hypothetical protein